MSAISKLNDLIYEAAAANKDLHRIDLTFDEYAALFDELREVAEYLPQYEPKFHTEDEPVSGVTEFDPGWVMAYRGIPIYVKR